MRDSQYPTAHHVLHPGDVALAFAGDRLETLLGSCVAVILTDSRRSFGAMCHIVHSGRPGPASSGDTAYAEHAMQALFARLRGIGIAPQLCQAYVYGGGNMFPQVFNHGHVGARNVQWIRDFLYQNGIAIQAASVGDSCYRKIAWTIGDREVEVQAVAITAAAGQAGSR